MPEVHHFSYGILTPGFAYAMSFVGSLLGLSFAARARDRTGRDRARWLVGAAVAIGGTGIWVMHFIAMLGYTVSSVPIRYDIALTLVSALIAVVVVGVGLFIVGFLEPKAGPLLVGGLITGSGVAIMHYTGMAAMHVGGTVHYNPKPVVLSVVIAVVAATAALWAALWVRGLPATIGAALIMAFAVSGMHYTGMAAMEVHAQANPQIPSGAGAMELLLPLTLGISLVTAALVLMLGVSPDESERRNEQQILYRMAQRRTR